MKRFFLLLVIPYAIGAGQPSSRIAGLPGAPFRMGFGADAMGLANAATAAPMETINGYYNPALLPFQVRPAVMISAGFLPLDRSLNFLSFSRSLPPSAGISLGMINAGVSHIEGRDSDGRKTSTYSTSENAFLLSFGLMASPQVAIGISTKILYYSLYEGISSTTVGFDFGGVALLTDEITIGFSLQDVGSKYKWDTSKLYGLSGNTTVDHFPVRKKLGISYRPNWTNGLLSTEVEILARAVFCRAGMQIPLHEQFLVRGGIDQLSFTEDVPIKPTMGFSMSTRISSVHAMLSYAFVLEAYSPGGMHLISVGAQFP